MAGSFFKENPKKATMLLCVLSIVLISASQFISFFILDAETSIGGIATINLDAEFYQSGASFKATADVEAGGAGGLIGGIVDLGGATGGDGGIEIEDQIFYFQGLERLQGMVGVLYDTTKNADYTVNLQTQNYSNARVNVNTHTDLIPWWPEGIAQEITITIKFNTSDNTQEIRINNVRLNLYTNWDERNRKYTEVSESIWEISPNDVLLQEGDSKSYRHSVALDSDMGDKIGLIAMVTFSITDIDGNPLKNAVTGFPSTGHPQEMVSIRPLAQSSFVSLIFMFLSFPLSILAIIIAVVGILYTHLERKRRKQLLFTAGLLQIFAVLFFINGANTLISLIDVLKAEDFTYNFLGLGIAILGGVLLLVAFFVQWKYGPKEPLPGEYAVEDELKFDISAAMAEEGAEDEEEFECPACGAAFEEMIAECPSCGAEFEGAEEEEEEDESEGFECPACGEGFDDVISECPKCGAEFDLDEEGEEEEGSET
jgi:DNA-directed RNA polymerase subunit RPC12/RpoP